MKKNQAQLANADTSINHEVDEGLYPIVLLSSPQFMSFVSRDTLIAFVVKYKREFTDQQRTPYSLMASTTVSPIPAIIKLELLQAGLL